MPSKPDLSGRIPEWDNEIEIPDPTPGPFDGARFVSDLVQKFNTDQQNTEGERLHPDNVYIARVQPGAMGHMVYVRINDGDYGDPSLDRGLGSWLLIGAAVIGGIVLTVMLFKLIRKGLRKFKKKIKQKKNKKDKKHKKDKKKKGKRDCDSSSSSSSSSGSD